LILREFKCAKNKQTFIQKKTSRQLEVKKVAWFKKLTNFTENSTPQWKISYKKRNLLAKIDLSGIQKPTGGIEFPLYGSSYPKVVLKILKGLSGNSCPKWPLSPLNPKEHVFFAATSGYLTNQKSKYEGL
jgi:hypothetical protein